MGETSSTAYRGDRGKTAYDHSQLTGNPHNTTFAQLGSKPTTLSGYGITDAVTNTVFNNHKNNVNGEKHLTQAQLTNLINLSNWWKWDETNQAVYTEENVYSEKEIAAYGFGSSGGGGGGSFVEWGATLNNYSPLIVEGVSKTLALSGHTHNWTDITGKPSTFIPSVHNHPFTEITGTATATQIPNLNASKITSGVFSRARLGTGTPTSANYLRGDGVWAAVTSANNGQLTLSTGTGLTGSATFTANQSGNSTFSVGIASTHALPTNAQVSNWNTAYGWGDYREYGLGTTLLNLSSSTLDFSGVTTFLRGQDSGLSVGRNYYGLSLQNSSTYGMQIVGRDSDWHVRGLENGTLTS